MDHDFSVTDEVYGGLTLRHGTPGPPLLLGDGTLKDTAATGARSRPAPWGRTRTQPAENSSSGPGAQWRDFSSSSHARVACRARRNALTARPLAGAPGAPPPHRTRPPPATLRRASADSRPGSTPRPPAGRKTLVSPAAPSDPRPTRRRGPTEPPPPESTSACLRGDDTRRAYRGMALMPPEHLGVPGSTTETPGPPPDSRLTSGQGAGRFRLGAESHPQSGPDRVDRVTLSHPRRGASPPCLDPARRPPLPASGRPPPRAGGPAAGYRLLRYPRLCVIAGT